MKREFETNWERELDARMKALPEMEAPMDLLANVMGAIEKRQTLAWYRRPYYTWSSGLKYGGGLILAVLGASIAVAAYYGFNAVSSSTEATGAGVWLESLFEIADGLGSSVAAIGRTILGTYALGILLFATVVYGSLFGTSAFVYRILKQRMGGEHVA
ncbi:MAG: hypothetical protein CBD18_05770 [Opitutales bacterium TMED158]|nr:MAG: hypothetical protein CBD18_05770 [Opitutales bacterium TMED158]